MTEPAPNYQTIASSATTEGLEDLFECEPQPLRDSAVTEAQPLRDGRVAQLHGLSFKDACTHYGLKATALRTRIKSGQIAAEKLDGPNGPEWRVFPERVPQPLRESSVTVAQPLRDGADNRLLDMIDNLQQKLEAANRELQAANFRVGYLENQVHERERDINELKLLTDSQHKASRWASFKKWFFGR